MNWLREHMRDQLANAASNAIGQNILSFPGDTPAASRYGTSSALDLVSEAAEVIRGIQDRAAESEARAKALAECALEKLQLAEARIHSAEAARGLAQDALSKLNARLQELTRTQSRIAAAENQLANAERQMRAAETRAINAEKAVNQIEDAIRAQLVGLQRNLTGRSARAA
jgi:DNA repair exonuclease SbcCD ATPase subunit